jgi:hypothetical protein
MIARLTRIHSTGEKAPIWVNSNFVLYVQRQPAGTVVTLGTPGGTDKKLLLVAETPEQAANILNGKTN